MPQRRNALVLAAAGTLHLSACSAEDERSFASEDTVPPADAAVVVTPPSPSMPTSPAAEPQEAGADAGTSAIADSAASNPDVGSAADASMPPVGDPSDAGPSDAGSNTSSTVDFLDASSDCLADMAFELGSASFATPTPTTYQTALSEAFSSDDHPLVLAIRFERVNLSVAVSYGIEAEGSTSFPSGLDATFVPTELVGSSYVLQEPQAEAWLSLDTASEGFQELPVRDLTGSFQLSGDCSSVTAQLNAAVLGDNADLVTDLVPNADAGSDNDEPDDEPVEDVPLSFTVSGTRIPFSFPAEGN